jgi:hypothetical protein
VKMRVRMEIGLAIESGRLIDKYLSIRNKMRQ